MYRLIISIILTAIALGMQAQDSIPTLRAVTSSYALEMGNAHLADTYLTPLHYRGTHYAVAYERDQAMRMNPQKWTMQLKLSMRFDDTENPAKNATMINAEGRVSWAMMRRWRVPYGFSLGIGPGISANGGVFFLSRNGNNPASAKVAATFDATGYACWSGKLWKLPLTVRYQPTLALGGIFFAPDYGELYYQIYLGDHEGLLHGAWPGNYFSLDNLVTADLHFGNTSLRIGYHNNIFTSKINHTVTRDIYHAVVIGFTTEWLSVRPNSPNIDARIISPY